MGRKLLNYNRRQPGNFRAIKYFGQVIIVRCFPVVDMCFGYNTPEVFRFQFIIIVCFDKQSYNRLAGFEINFNIVLGKMPRFQKLPYLVVSHA
jgi:hypothetical protein